MWVGIATTQQAGWPRNLGSNPGTARIDFSLGHTQPPIQSILLAVSSGWSGRSVKLTSTAEVKNDEATPPLLHTSSWRGAKWIKRRNNFTFYTRIFTSLCMLTFIRFYFSLPLSIHSFTYSSTFAGGWRQCISTHSHHGTSHILPHTSVDGTHYHTAHNTASSR
jgi:hypothetical protein